ncbi:hypothetical protein ACW0KB_02270 [Virgibacillus salarius]
MKKSQLDIVYFFLLTYLLFWCAAQMITKQIETTLNASIREKQQK